MEEKKAASIEELIFEIRGQKVMMDSDLAELYEIGVKVLNQAVKRNIERFPADFMFQLSQEEWTNLRSQKVTSSSGLKAQVMISNSNYGGRRYAPFVFTEQGVAMLSGVINSQKAIEVNINIMRAFVQLRRYIVSQVGTSEQIAELRTLLMLYIEKNDKRVNNIIIALNNLLEKPKETKRIGF